MSGPSRNVRSLLRQDKIGDAVSAMRAEGYRLTRRTIGQFRAAARHAEKALSAERSALAELRLAGDPATPVLDRQVARSARTLADIRALIAEHDQAEAAKILNTWAAADERR